MSNNINPNDFRIVDKAKNPRETTIERSNIKNSFTFGDVLNHQRDLEKFKTELTAQMKVTKATMDNIERNHEWVKDMTEEKLHHAWMYFENLDLHKKSESKLVEVEEQLSRYSELRDVLFNKFGITDEQDKSTEGE